MTAIFLVLLAGVHAAPDDPMGRDARAVARYLDGPAIDAALAACAPAAACGPPGDALVGLNLRVLGEGRVAEAQVTGLDGPTADCWQARLLACPLPRSDEAQEWVQLSLPIHQGRALPAQALHIAAPQRLPVLLRVPPALAPEQAAALIDAIWPPAALSGDSAAEGVYTRDAPAPVVPGDPSEKAPDGP